MKSKFVLFLWAIFALLAALFAFALTPLRQLTSARFEIFPGIPLILLGIAQAILAISFGGNRILKSFMIVTGVSAAGWPSSLFLHSFLYQYFPTEPVTYILFFIVFPLTFIVGTVGSIVTGAVLLSRRK